MIWQFYYSKINQSLRYIGVKDFSTELNCKKSLNVIQYLEYDILNYSLTQVSWDSLYMFGEFEIEYKILKLNILS